MSIDKSKLPPPLAKLLTDLEAKGVTVEMIMGNGLPPELNKTSETSSRPSDEPCGCSKCASRRVAAAQARDRLAQALGIPPDVQAVLEAQAERTVNQLTDAVKEMNEPMRLELQRQVEINDANMERIAELNRNLGDFQRTVGDLKTELSNLKEAHRRQVGLLHKRVTKRKGEVADVKVRVASTRGRVTRVEKKLT